MHLVCTQTRTECPEFLVFFVCSLGVFIQRLGSRWDGQRGFDRLIKPAGV